MGVKFRPGGFHPFRPQALSKITGKALTLLEAFGREREGLESEVLACGWNEFAAVSRAEAFLLSRLPDRDPYAERARQAVEFIRDHPEVLRVEEAAYMAGLGVRALQRLFSEYVGVSPKWVIQRYRLHEAMASLEEGESMDFPALALQLGYFDQAHFIKDFKLLLGRTPATYLKG